jgi:hypothetical protein
VAALDPELLLAPGPAVAKRLTAGNNMLAMQTQYCREPALVLFKTNQGNYAKALLRAEQTGGSPYHAAVWDARCYARDQATFNAWPYMAGGSPSNTEYTQLFERGGYLLNTWMLDFDRDGENPVSGQEDVFLQNPSGPTTQRLLPRNGAVLAY